VSRDLVFNVIFMPDTVPYLCLGVQSLLNHSPYRFRLVSNGLTGQELEQLKAYADTDERLGFYAYPTRLPVDHGTLLTLLFHQQSDAYFCFLDSDIFATGPFDAWLENHLDSVDALSSCSALFWETLPPAVGFSGRCTETPTGNPLLSSFFAVYRREVVAEAFMAGITFEKRMSPLHMSPHEQALAKAEGWTGQMIDTAKLVNFELARRGYRLAHQECGSLVHIGGISWWLWRAKGAERDMLSKPEVITDADLAPHEGHKLPIHQLQKQVKEVRARWFSALLYHLFGRAAEPTVDIADPSLRQQVETTRNLIAHTFQTAGYLSRLPTPSDTDTTTADA
jgi:hypothetical protein